MMSRNEHDCVRVIIVGMRKTLRSAKVYTLIAVTTVFGIGAVASAWTAPTATPPNNNVAAPINVGASSQVKNGNIGVNGLAVFGNTLLGGSAGSNAYLNWGATAGSSGYGIRDNAGNLEFKNSGGTWSTLQTLVYNLGGSGQWTTSGSNIYYNGGNVGIGTASPQSSLQIGSMTALYDAASSGNATFSRNLAYNGGWKYIAAGTGSDIFMNGDIILHTSPTGAAGGAATLNDRLHITNDGNVGIGTASPGTKLDVRGMLGLSQGGSGGAAWINFWSGDVPAISVGKNMPIRFGQTNTYNGMDYWVENMRVDTSGNVGIGIPGPAYKLDVNGTIRSLNGLIVSNAGGAYSYINMADDESPNGWKYVHANSNNIGFLSGQGGWIFRVDNAGNTVATAASYATAFYYSSDQRLKKDIATIASASALSNVLQLRPVTFNWIDPHQDNGKEQIGFIAQEVRKVVPDLVSENASTTLLSVDYARVTPLLVGSVQELNAKIESQQKEIDDLKQQVAALSQSR